MKTVFQKENVQFNSRLFFLLLKLPMARRAQICRNVGVLSNTNVGCHRGSESETGWSASRFSLKCLRHFGYLLSFFLFSISKHSGFFDKSSEFFRNWDFFHGKNTFSDET